MLFGWEPDGHGNFNPVKLDEVIYKGKVTKDKELQGVVTVPQDREHLSLVDLAVLYPPPISILGEKE